MRQVPTEIHSHLTYGIVGRGRLAKHFSFYLKSLGLSCKSWSRGDTSTCGEALASVDVILVLINDDQIEPFIAEQKALIKTGLSRRDPLTQQKWVHFSGSLVTPLAFGAHPLMTFASDLYEKDFYPQIPFITDEVNGSFETLFPQLKNVSFKISAEFKPLYHALCVMAGNFTTLLWQKAFEDFERKLNLPREILWPYLTQTSKNLVTRSSKSLTGPLARGDVQTIKKNIRSLEGDKYQAVYESFVAAYKPQLEGDL